MTEIKISTPFIKLDQFLKFTGMSFNGAEAKSIIKDGSVKVNGETELRRGKKLYEGDTVLVITDDGQYEFKVK